MIDLGVSIAGIDLENPFVLASGILDENGYTLVEVLRSGASAVVTKSIGLEERKGYIPPVVYELPYGLLNAIGLSNPGIEHYSHEISIAIREKKPIIGSVFGSTPEEFAHLSSRMEDFGVSAVELNLSCPHVKGYGQEVGSDPNLVRDIVRSVKRKVDVPVFAKLSPNVSDIQAIAEAAIDADGFTLINTVKAMKIDIYARQPVLSNVYGGLSGSAIKPVGIRYVYEIASNFDRPIFGVGGITTAEDAVEYIMAGASAVQVGTAVARVGKRVFNKLISEMRDFMEREGFSKIGDMKGVALRR